MEKFRIGRICHRETLMPELLSYLPRGYKLNILYHANRASRQYLGTHNALLDKKPDFIRNFQLRDFRTNSVTKSFKMQDSINCVLRATNLGRNFLILGCSDQTILIFSDVDDYRTFKILYFSSYVNTMIQADEERIYIGSYREIQVLRFDEHGFLFKKSSIRVEEAVTCFYQVSLQLMIVGQY